MDKNILEAVVKEQMENFSKKSKYLIRTFPDNLIKSKKICVISGIRRSGKSTLLKEIVDKLNNKYYYLNFEDERLLDFTYSDFNNLYEIFLKLYGEHKLFFFDEIQNIYGWEKFVRRLFEDGNKIFVTGSNAKLLSSELATTLTGRHLKYELYPFSFKEYLMFNKFKISKIYTTKEKSILLRHFSKFIELGGFPEVVESSDKEELKQLYQDTLIKDLVVRFKIRDVKSFRELILFLISNVSKKISFNNLKLLLGFKSTTTVKNYIEFLEEVYLLFSLYKFDYSIKKQIINDRKIYAIDTGLANAVSFQFSENIGRLLENIVFIELKRQKKEIYYHFKSKECDFIIREGIKIVKAIQVTKSLSNPDTKKREIEGLVEAMKTYGLKDGLILTEDEEFEIENGEFGLEACDKNSLIKIKVMPIWKWLLTES